MIEPLLELSDLKYRWSGRSTFLLAVPQLSLNRGETALLLGQSGSGKSTLLSLISGTIVPYSGSVCIAGQELSKLSGRKLDRFRAENIGVIFQQFNLLPFATVADNIKLPLRFAPERRKRVADTNAEVINLCAELDLPKGIEDEKASTLSVGQQQRVAVARALIGHPPLIIADEPTSALDADTQSAFLDVLFEQVAANRTTLLMVSHDARLSSLFDRVIHLEDIAGIERAEV